MFTKSTKFREKKYEYTRKGRFRKSQYTYAHTFIRPQYSCSSDVENTWANFYGSEYNNVPLEILGIDRVEVQPFIFWKVLQKSDYIFKALTTR